MDSFSNPYDELEINRGKLPHWYKAGATYFVTFRLADSLPKKKVEELKKDREMWKIRIKDKKELSREDWNLYNRLFNDRVEEWLHSGYGSCLLKKKENAEIMAKTLRFFDGERYNLDEWVIMPNHIHVLVRPKEGFHLNQILHSWKSYSAHMINKLENRKGELWMRESFDHIVRNEQSLEHYRKYIRENPIKGGM